MKSSNSDTEFGSQVFKQQVAHLYNNAPLSLVFTVGIGLLLALLQRPVISNQVLLIWYFVLLVLTSIRAMLVYAYHKSNTATLTVNQWYWAYLGGTTLAGLVWGSSAIYLFPIDSLGHQLFVVFVLAGMTAGSVPVLAASMVAFLLFSVPVLVSLALMLFFTVTDLSVPMAAMVLVYLLGISIAAKDVHRTIISSLLLRFDNRGLAKTIIDHQSAEDELFKQKERLQITFSAMAEGVITTKQDGVIDYLNPAAETMTGWTFSEINGQKVDQVFSHFDENTGDCSDGAISTCLRNSNQSRIKSLLLTKSGTKKNVEEIATPLKDRAGKIIGAVAIIRDITQESEHSRQLAYQASHDDLTDLPNRTLLSDRLEHAIKKAFRANNLIAVLYMDLDRFKQINDSLGHYAGDKLLSSVAERLSATVRQEDTVARIGGDEFVVILEGLVTHAQAHVVAEKIVENLAEPIRIENQKIAAKVSIGITIFPRDGNDVETLLKNADTAMYRTKELAGSSFQFYNSEMSARVSNKLKLEQQVQEAIGRDQLELHYQPRVDVESGEILGIEALVRWHASTDKPITPAEFINIAEETGSILNIGEWVLETACKQAQLWIQSGHNDLQIAVNLSVRQILSSGLVGFIAQLLIDTGLHPKHLELEITESLFLKDAEHAINVLKDLKALGVKLAIDDFGSGYSSLAYINRFPVDIIKIDKSFIDDITSESTDIAIVPAIIAMGHGLNLEVIAEGVENEVQRRYLNSLECDSFQGFYFSKPLPADAITHLLTNHFSSSQAVAHS